MGKSVLFWCFDPDPIYTQSQNLCAVKTFFLILKGHRLKKILHFQGYFLLCFPLHCLCLCLHFVNSFRENGSKN